MFVSATKGFQNKSFNSSKPFVPITETRTGSCCPNLVYLWFLSEVTFTHSYFQTIWPKQVAHAQPYPPFGTILPPLICVIRDTMCASSTPCFCSSADELLPVLIEFKPDALVIYDDGFNYLTKMCLSNMREAAFKMQKHALNHNCKVIVTSSDASDHAEKYLNNGAHFVITGEAEHTYCLINAFKRRNGFWKYQRTGF